MGSETSKKDLIKTELSLFLLIMRSLRNILKILITAFYIHVGFDGFIISNHVASNIEIADEDTNFYLHNHKFLQPQDDFALYPSYVKGNIAIASQSKFILLKVVFHYLYINLIWQPPRIL